MGFLSLIWLMACDVPYDVPRLPPDAGEQYTVPEAWRRVRREAMLPKACFAERGPYCIGDRDVVDAAIQRDLDEHFHGRMPLNERWTDEVIARARAVWSTAMKEEHRTAVEALVRANWEEPAVVRRGARVDVSLFVPPGRLRLRDGDWRIETDLEDRGQLRGRDAASRFAGLRETYPKLPLVRLLIDIPVDNGRTFRRWDVRHLLATDQVLWVDPLDDGAGWVSEPIGDWGPYIRGERSLHRFDLRRCAVGKMLEAPDCTRQPPLPPEIRAPKGRKKGVDRAGWDPGQEL
jgi:hypothetical protein